MEIGRRLYYDVKTFEVIQDTGERRGYVQFTTIEQDIEKFISLKERVRESYDVIELPFGAYAKDFAECALYRINPDTLTPEFSYPNHDETNPSEPVYQKPLSEEVQELKVAQATTDSALLELMESILLP